jgi:hypothetical protein
VVDGAAIRSIPGTITIPDVPAGRYEVTWWNTYSTTNPIFLTQTVAVSKQLLLTLPVPFSSDVGVKVRRLEEKRTAPSRKSSRVVRYAWSATAIGNKQAGLRLQPGPYARSMMQVA